MNNRARVLGGVLLALFGLVILLGGFVALRSRPSVRPEAEHGVAGGDRGRESSMASATASTPSTGEPEGGNGGAGSALSGPGKGAPKVPGVGARKYADFDRRQERGLGEQGPTAEQSAAVAALRREVSGLEVQFDPVTRSANHVMALGGFLSGGAQGMESLKRFVDEHAVLFGHKASVLDAGARVLREDENAHNGMRSLVWQQELDGVPLYETILRANLTREGELITMGSHFVSDPSLASGMEAGERNALVERSPVDPARAVALAAANVDQRVEPSGVRPVSEALGTERRQRLEAPGLSDVNAGLAWLPTGPEAMQLVWDVIFTSRKQREMFRVLVDARTGEVWKRTSLTRSLSNASYRVHVNAGTLTPLDSPRPMSPGLASPGTTQPPEVARSLVTLSALDPVASPNGWIADGGTRTFGNNVDAHLDLVDSDPGYGEGVHAVSATRTFDFPLDLTSAPSASRDAAITTLFYLSNWYHDKLYALGFTESAGNFQQSNFSKGGRGGDAVLADAQDGGGTNNANFSTPPDGMAGRMQMYLFTGPNPDRDGSLDAEVVIHELTHGLSNRLVGGGVGISALQPAGMGEGWSDFYALCLLSESGDDVNANYAAGGYLTANYYRGIRRYPYTTNLAKNPLTLKRIDPTLGGSSEVHDMGEVWCVALWEVRASLITRYGWAEGNQRMLQLVTDGMKLCPVNPTFLQARNAILQADLVSRSGADRSLLWAGFAKRGMGASAAVPASNSASGVVEAFDVPVPPVVSVTATAPNAVESGVAGVFQFTRTGSLAGSLTVGFVLGGSASNGVDYRAIAVPSSVVIPAGLMSGTLAVVPLQDAQFEGAETVVLTLSPSLDYTVGASASATVTIEDDDYPQPTISSPLSASTFAGVPFQYQIVAANTPVVPGATITYGATGLPAGLVVDPVSGLISGTVVSAWEGVVTLRATNPYRTATASLALLVKAPPSIRTQPLGGTWRESDPLVLSVAAEGSGPLAYRWKRGDQWITGGTQSTLRVNAPLSAAVAGSYRVEVSNAYGTATSAVVEVGVILAARVVTPPSGVRVDVGQAFSLQAVVSGTPPFTYQWMKNGANLSNQTQATLSVGAARPADAGRYQVLVMNAAGGMLSSGADVLVNVPPTILSSPANTSVNLGSALRLSVVADGTPPMSYQWRKGGQPIAGGTQATLLVGSVQEGGGGSYDVVVTNVAGSATSAASVVSVNLPPRVVVHPENQGVNPGGELVLSVVAEGTGVLRYRWWRDGVGILGAESDTLRLSGVDEGYVGNYWVQVSNAVGTVDSRAATVTLNRPVRILSQPAGMQREVGQSARLEVAADGTGPLQYRWLRNGTVLGGTGAALNFESLGKADEGVYQVEVSNVVGALRSAEVFLKVNDYARILSQPLGVVGKVGRAAVLSVGAVGSGTLSYQWYRNGAELAEGRGATLRLEGLEKGQEGDYDVVVSSGEASQRSAAARVQVIGIGEVQGNYGGSLERNAAGVAAGAGRYPGRLSVALTGRGLFSGMLQWEGGRYVVRGQMDGEMGTVSEIGRGTRGALRVRMQVNWVNGGPELSVEVEEDGLGAGMEARGRMRMVRVDPVNLPVTGATHYTVLLTPGAGGGLPEAPGYATLDVGRTGVTVLSGRLGDGTMVTDSGLFGADRRVAVQMPVRAAAFPFSGYVGGVLEVSGLGVGANVGGVLDWRRPGGGTGALAAVYAGSLAASGGVYRSPALSGGTDAWVGRSGSAQWRSVAGGGNVAAAMTLFGNYGLVLSGTGSEQVRLLRVDRVSGVVRGIYLEAGGRGVKRMEGVFLQGEGRMGGFILDPLGASGSWSAQFAPAP